MGVNRENWIDSTEDRHNWSLWECVFLKSKRKFSYRNALILIRTLQNNLFAGNLHPKSFRKPDEATRSWGFRTWVCNEYLENWSPPEMKKLSLREHDVCVFMQITLDWIKFLIRYRIHWKNTTFIKFTILIEL